MSARQDRFPLFNDMHGKDVGSNYIKYQHVKMSLDWPTNPGFIRIAIARHPKGPGHASKVWRGPNCRDDGAEIS